MCENVHFKERNYALICMFHLTFLMHNLLHKKVCVYDYIPNVRNIHIYVEKST